MGYLKLLLLSRDYSQNFQSSLCRFTVRLRSKIETSGWHLRTPLCHDETWEGSGLGCLFSLRHDGLNLFTFIKYNIRLDAVQCAR